VPAFAASGPRCVTVETAATAPIAPAITGDNRPDTQNDEHHGGDYSRKQSLSHDCFSLIRFFVDSFLLQILPVHPKPQKNTAHHGGARGFKPALIPIIAVPPFFG
jgi:hypothetical protein